jgi:hypothetical protein
MPNFGKVFCFMKFNVNSLKLQEVLVAGMRMKGITSIHNLRRLQEKAKNPSLSSIFLFTIFHKNGHFLVSSPEKITAYSRAIMVIFSITTRSFDQVVGPFLTKVVTFYPVYGIEHSFSP